MAQSVGKNLFKEIEKNSWIFIIVCVTITTILGKISVSLGIFSGAVIVLYNLMFLYLNIERLFDKAARQSWVVFSYLGRLIIITGLVYLAVVILKANVGGIIGGMLIVIGVMMYSSFRCFYKGGTF